MNIFMRRAQGSINTHYFAWFANEHGYDYMFCTNEHGYDYMFCTNEHG